MTEKESKYESWTTRSEINFIKGLGTFARKDRAVERRTRGELLALYIAAAHKRVNWDAIDKNAVIQFAQEALRHCIAN